MAGVRAIALYLPQFHPIPENDAWWGRGFTEWTNTAKAKPLFPGHRQPNVPADLGFYDLRVPEARQAQTALARAHGIEAFCYYHYWFAGRRLLERPFEEVLASGQPDFPFCLCWANHSWTGVWCGAPHRMLIEQTYPGVDDHRRHFEWLLRAFLDPRYVRVEERPLFLVFRPDEIPNAAEVTGLWRTWAKEAGLPGLFLVGQHHGALKDAWCPRSAGFDAAFYAKLPTARRARLRWRRPLESGLRVYRAWRRWPTIADYSEAVGSMLQWGRGRGEDVIPCALPNWDNTPRSGSGGVVLRGSTPERFRGHVREAIDLLAGRPPERKLLLIKSWNEWAEGNYLEPDLRHGARYLEVLGEEIARG